MILVGFLFLAIYIQNQDVDSLGILNYPSYYVTKNYWMMFLAGIVVLVFSEFCSFFSWFKKMDPVKEALPNAGYASANEINTWVGGTSVDAGKETEIIKDDKLQATKKTEILSEGTSIISDTTILTGQDVEEIASDEDKTTILQEEGE